MGRISEHFTEEEFRCKCGCGGLVYDATFIELLERLRAEAGAKAIHISSGYRCPKYNAQVSHTKSLSGPHTKGLAADILCSGSRAHEILRAAFAVGIPRIGINQRGAHESRFIHVDIMRDTIYKPWIWSY